MDNNLIDDQDRHSNEKSGGIEKKRSLASRWFGPLHAGSYRGSLVTLTCSMMGIGFLTLPVMGKTNGLVPMVFFILVASLVSGIANWQLGIGFRATKARSLTTMISSVNGKTSAIFCIFFLVLDIWVSVGALYIFGARFAISLLDSFNARPSWEKDTDTLSNYVILGLFLLSFGGSLARNLSSLRYFTFVTSSITLLVGLLVVYQAPLVREYYMKDLGAQFPLYVFDNRLFSAYCLSLFSTNNQYSVVSVMSEFYNPTERRVNKLVFWAAVIPIFIYLLVSIGGFLSCGDKCKQIIVNRMTPEGFKDLTMDGFKVLLLMCLVVGNVLRAQTNRTAILDLYDQIFQRRTDPIENPDPSSSIKGEKISENLNPSTLSTGSENQPSSSEVAMGFYTLNLPLQLMNNLLPAITAILVKDNLIKYVATCTGFLAPVFMIIYPCLISIKLYRSKRITMGKAKYSFIWTYLILETVITYISLIMNIFNDSLGLAYCKKKHTLKT